MGIFDWDGDVLVKFGFNWIDSQRPYPVLVLLVNEGGVLRMRNGSAGLYDLESPDKVDTISRFSSEDIDNDGDDDIIFFNWFGDYYKMTLDYIINDQNGWETIRGGIRGECLNFGGGGYGGAYLDMHDFGIYSLGIFIGSLEATVASCGNYLEHEFYLDKVIISRNSAEGDIDGDGINEFFILHTSNRLAMANTENLNQYGDFEVTLTIGKMDGITILDINKDTYDDLVMLVTQNNQQALYYLRSLGNGYFEAPKQITPFQEIDKENMKSISLCRNNIRWRVNPNRHRCGRFNSSRSCL